MDITKSYTEVVMRFILVLVLAFSAPAYAQVYKWTDENGVTHFGNQPPPGEQEEVDIRESRTGSMVTDSQRRMLEERERSERIRALERQRESYRGELADRPDYICRNANDRIKSLRERWDSVKRNGYSIQQKNYYEDRIKQAERHRDNVCR